MSDVIVVASFGSKSSAEVAKSALEGNGINAYIESDDAGGMYPFMTEQIRLLVRKEDEENALKVLNK